MVISLQYLWQRVSSVWPPKNGSQRMSRLTRNDMIGARRIPYLRVHVPNPDVLHPRSVPDLVYDFSSRPTGTVNLEFSLYCGVEESVKELDRLQLEYCAVRQGKLENMSTNGRGPLFAIERFHSIF